MLSARSGLSEGLSPRGELPWRGVWAVVAATGRGVFFDHLLGYTFREVWVPLR